MQHLIAAGIIAVAATLAAAQSDSAFTYQGSLNDNGEKANGNFDMEVSLWTAEAGGSQVGSPIPFTDVPVVDGVFTIELDFVPESFNNQARFLQFSIEGTLLAPRQRITRTPYALQTRGIFVDDQQRIGIGTTAPLASLEVAQLDANVLVRSIGNDFGPKLKLRNTATGLATITGTLEFEDPSLVAAIGHIKPFIGPAGLQFSGPSGANMKITDNGNVGIGTTDPLRILHVAGDAFIDGSDTGSLLFADNSSTALTANAIRGDCAGGAAISGRTTRATGVTYGIVGTSESTSGTGVRGVAGATTGVTTGVEGRSESGSGRGVYGLAFAGGGTSYGMWAESRSPQGRGIYAVATATSGNTIGVLGQVNSSAGWAGYFSGPAGSWNYFQRNVGLGVITPSFQLQLSSNSAAKPTSNVWTISSDRRLKKNITPIQSALNDLMQLKGVTYQWKDPASQGDMEGTYTGMIAQDVERVFPEWISEDPDGYKTLTVIGFEGLVVEALRDLREEKDMQVNALRAELESQRQTNEDLRRRLEALESLVSRTAAIQSELPVRAASHSP